MRVVAGEYRGRRLKAPAGTATRPTADRVREALFNILGDVSGAVVLDLYAGSGALGIEALSRGARRALLVDRDDAAVRVIRRNLAALGLEPRGRAVRAEVTRWLAGHVREVSGASVVFLDPPYNDAVLDHALALLDTLAAEGTTVVAEHAHRQALPGLARLRPVRQRRYGDTAVSVLTM